MLSDAPFEVPQYLLDLAKGLDRVPMAVAGADNMVVMESARQAADAGLIDPILVGDRDEIESLAETMGWAASEFRIVESGEEDEAAAARMAVKLARDGEVAALMKGHVHTDALMAAVVAKETGLRDGVSWHGAPFTTSDAIYRDDDGRVRFHYLIAQCFCEAAPTAALAAGDDALDARWFTLDDVANAGGDVAGNCRRILARAEALFAAGLLPGDGEGRP